MSAELKASRRNATLILTLSDPAAKNALHPDMVAAAIEALSTAERDDSIHAVILTGADHFFCSGSSLTRQPANHAKEVSEQVDVLDRLHGLIEALRDCPKPVIAAVEGIAADVGFSLALACDLIVAGASAQFQMAHAKAGLRPDGGSAWFLAQALPRQLATEMMLEGKPIAAQRLHVQGIINKIVADGTALDVAMNWADELAERSPNTVERIKSLLADAPAHTLVQHLSVEKEGFIDLLLKPHPSTTQ